MMKNKLVILCIALALTGCSNSKAASSVSEDVVLVEYVDTTGQLGEGAPDADPVMIAHEEKQVDSVSADEVSENEIEDTVSRNYILPEGLRYNGDLICPENPMDFKGNINRYLAVTDYDGNPVYDKTEALTYAELDFVMNNDDYDGSRELLTISGNEGVLDIQNDYRIPSGRYKFTTNLPVSHLTMYIEGNPTEIQEVFLTSEEDGSYTTDIRDNIVVNGNLVNYTREGDIVEPLNNGVAMPEGVDIRDYTVSHNIVKYKELDR